MEKMTKRGLSGLAEMLLVRHLQESWPRPHDEMRGWFPDGKAPRHYDESIRTVAVVGAGASAPIFALADELASELEEEIDVDKADREAELARLENVYDLNPEAFETRLAAICRTPEAERKVRARISERYRHRHPTLLVYELLAHLLHHRFLDAVISFNFDELLDQSIDDELSDAEYTKIVSERDVEPGAKLDGPAYIKMHGTASEPDSLRFTRERYYWTPKSILTLVEDQFDVDHLVVLNFGFRMNSFDLQRLLSKPRQLSIYHFDPKEFDPKVGKEIRKLRKRERKDERSGRSSSYDAIRGVDLSGYKASRKKHFLSELTLELVGELEEACAGKRSGPASWRSTLRHQAVVELLRESDVVGKDHYVEYLRRRTILELAFTAAKGRGAVAVAAMVKDRCGRYFDLYQQVAGPDADSWRKLCYAGGLIEGDRSPEGYTVLPRVCQESGGDADIHRLHLAEPSKLARHVMKNMVISPERRTDAKALLTMTLSALQTDTEIEMHSCDDRICSKVFTRPLILKTLTALQGWTLKMLHGESEYNEVWLVAESGNWLEQEDIKRVLKDRLGRHGKIKLINAFDTKLELPNKLKVKKRPLPWGRHNRHMTIICDRGKPLAAIYFVRRLRAPTVTPVFLSNQKDLDRVANAFEVLWKEAKAYRKGEYRKIRSAR
jgi:SIR2-like domain